MASTVTTRGSPVMVTRPVTLETSISPCTPETSTDAEAPLTQTRAPSGTFTSKVAPARGSSPSFRSMPSFAMRPDPPP